MAVKAGTEDADVRVPCENVTITGCSMVHGHGGVVLGSEMSGDIRRVAITGCVFDGTDRGVRIKSRRGRGGRVQPGGRTGAGLAEPQVPVMNAVATPVTCAGLRADYVRGLHLSDLRIVGARGEEIMLHDVK